MSLSAYPVRVLVLATFLLATPTCSWGMRGAFIRTCARATNFIVQTFAGIEPEQDSTEKIHQGIRDAFIATQLPNQLLSEICGYCNRESVALMTITLPDNSWIQQINDGHYASSAISVSFINDQTLSVLTTNNIRRLYRLPDGYHITDKPAHISRSLLRNQLLPEGSVFVASQLVQDTASNDYYEAKITDPVTDIANGDEIVGSGYPLVKGRVWYDWCPVPMPPRQARTTIKISERKGGTLASILGVDLPKMSVEKKDDEVGPCQEGE